MWAQSDGHGVAWREAGKQPGCDVLKHWSAACLAGARLHVCKEAVVLGAVLCRVRGGIGQAKPTAVTMPQQAGGGGADGEEEGAGGTQEHRARRAQHSAHSGRH